MRMPHLSALPLAAAALLSVAAAHAHADFLASVSVTTPALGASTAYIYTVTDAAASTENIGQFALAVPLDANLFGFLMPAGYLVDYTPGNPAIFFDSTDPATDIHPGQSASFAFLSALAPASSSFQLFNYDTGDSLQGTTQGPNDPVSVTPEPESLALLGTGLPLIAAVVRRRFRNV